jgi:FKBP-type peptidyl-prolyl cis-trans isomerase
MRPVVFALVALLGCQRTEERKITQANVTDVPAKVGSGSATAQMPTTVDQIAAPLDIKNPPIDAIKTSSGLIYKKLPTDTVVTGEPPKRNDTVSIIYTGWRQTTGETFFSNRGRQPMPLPLANTAAGFTEAMQLLKQGEKAMLWLPPSIGYKGGPPPGTPPETLVYEVEIVAIQSAPPVPPDLAGPTGPNTKLANGVVAAIVKPGTGKEKPKPWDTVTFNYSAWDKDGRMFDSTEMRKRAATVPVYRQSPAMEAMLTSMLPASRVRFWVPSQLMQGGKAVPGMPEGLLVYELELMTIVKGKQPPAAPPDVAAPPANAQKTARGVSYKFLKKGKGGDKPSEKDTVKVAYTGWTTDGRMIDSSLIKGEPVEFSLQGVMTGWTDGIPVMSKGDKARFWIPEQLAYASSPGKPQGMLVFDVELIDFKPVLVENPDGGDPHGEAPAPPAPPDVAGPPADAKKSPLGVSYKILKAVPNAPRPVADGTIKVHYQGWQTDGTYFDGSRAKGEPYTTSLRSVITGWKDAFPLIGVGEHARLWIPAELAYPNGGGPSGMLVFDVELIEIL